MPTASEIPTIRLREGAVELVSMPAVVAAALNRHGVAQVSPWADGEWRVANIARVGAVRLDGVEIRIEPKVPIRNLFHLLSRGQSWGQWREEELRLGAVDELYPAIAQAFLAHTARILRGGVLRGYVERRDAEATIRGRILIGEQIRRRTGVPLPVEIQYDDFTADIAVNQMLRTAARRLIGSGRIPGDIRSALLGVDRQLGEAALLGAGQPLPEIDWDRRNERYRTAVALAELILTNGSLDHRVGGTAASGFLLTLSTVFEEFVKAEVVRAAQAHGGWIESQERVPLDRDAQLHIQPDLVWRDAHGVRAVLDAKYKAEKPSGFPNADIYQMLAYCARHRVSYGHLIYAAGNEEAARYHLAEAGVTVVCHALVLDADAATISAHLDRIVAEVARGRSQPRT